MRFAVDRNPGDKEAKTKFQYVNDAYSVLANTSKKRQYDIDRQSAQLYNPLVEPGREHQKQQKQQQQQYKPQSDANAVFEDEFGDLLGDEMASQSDRYFWQPVGGVSGAAMGFIVANLPGAIAGYAAGSYLGRIRDKRGKSVMEVFNELPANRKAEILTSLAQKIFSLK